MRQDLRADLLHTLWRALLRHTSINGISGKLKPLCRFADYKWGCIQAEMLPFSSGSLTLSGESSAIDELLLYKMAAP